MDQDKILLEIYGKVSSSDTKLDSMDKRMVEMESNAKAMWIKIDNHSACIREFPELKKKVDSNHKWITGLKAVVAALLSGSGLLYLWNKIKGGI